MPLPEGLKQKFTTVTPLSKNIALAMVILLPFLGFIVGYKYRTAITKPTIVEVLNCSQCVKDQPEEAEKCPICPTFRKPQGEEIVSANLIGCDIYIETDTGDKAVIGRLNGIGMETPACISSSYTNFKISPSGKYLVFQDVSGGIDSMIRIYSLVHGDTNQLYVYGTSTISGVAFMPEDVLVVMNGYPGIPEEHWVTAYDVEGLYADIETVLDPQYKYFKMSLAGGAEYFRRLELEKFEVDYVGLRIIGETLRAETELAGKYTEFSSTDYSF